MYQVIDLTNGEPVFEGSLEHCEAWVSAQSDYFTYWITTSVPYREFAKSSKQSLNPAKNL